MSRVSIFQKNIMQFHDLNMKIHVATCQHILKCYTCFDACLNGDISLNNFDILEKCNSNFDAIINEALHIQHNKSKLNSQLYNSGQSFLLNIYN